MTVQWITMRGYIGGSENMAWYRAFLRTDRKRDSNTASDYYCFFVLYISPKEPEQLDAGHCNLLHYPRYPWEQKWSYGSYTAMISLLIHPFRAKCCTRCFTMPVFAKELEYREYCSGSFFPPTFSPGWEVDFL